MSNRRETENFRWARGFLNRRGYRYRFQWELYENLLGSSIPGDGVWVDLGCGDNRWLGRVPARVQLGVDIRVHEALRDRRLVRADVLKLPFADGGVDALSARFVIEHLAEPKAFFCEAARVLRQGGSLVLQTTNIISPPVFLSSLVPHFLKRCLIGRIFNVSETDVFPTYHRYNTPARFRRPLSGLVPTTVVMHSGVSFSRRWLFLMGYFYERVTDVRPLRPLKMNVSAVYKKV
jgi:SAM-dependent methyltransferase